MRNVVIGACVAGGAALLFAVVVHGGEHGWKLALAALGLVLWVAGGLSKES
jgi:hypothetical protein